MCARACCTKLCLRVYCVYRRDKVCISDALNAQMVHPCLLCYCQRLMFRSVGVGVGGCLPFFSLICLGQTPHLHTFTISDHFTYIQLYNMINLDLHKNTKRDNCH